MTYNPLDSLRYLLAAICFNYMRLLTNLFPRVELVEELRRSQITNEYDDYTPEPYYQVKIANEQERLACIRCAAYSAGWLSACLFALFAAYNGPVGVGNTQCNTRLLGIFVWSITSVGLLLIALMFGLEALAKRTSNSYWDKKEEFESVTRAESYIDFLRIKRKRKRY